MVKYFQVEFVLINMVVSLNSTTTGATSREGIVFPSEAHEFTNAQSFCSIKCLVDNCPFSFCHCVFYFLRITTSGYLFGIFTLSFKCFTKVAGFVL